MRELGFEADDVVLEDAGGRLDIATRTDGGTHSRAVTAAAVAFGTRSSLTS